MRALILLGIPGLVIGMGSASAQTVTPDDAMRAAIHPVGDAKTMQAWLSRVPVTRDFPDDFTATLRGHGAAFVIEMTTAPGCVPCGDLWSKLTALGTRYGWQVRTIGAQEAMIRSGRLGLPWVGQSVINVKSGGRGRLSTLTIGTDHAPNLARNLYLAAKMLTGVRPAVGVRAMSKFTGIVGLPATRNGRH